MNLTNDLPEAWKICFDEIRRFPAFKEMQMEWVPETGSTNDDLKKDWNSCHVPGRLRVARHQTRGRGQFERSWLDFPGSSLLFSFSQTLSLENLNSIPVSLRVGVAIWRALQETSLLGARELFLKWPNDIWTDEGKVGGILVESVIRGDCADLVVGLGLNVSGKPSEEFLNADWIQRKNNNPVTPQVILALFCQEWERMTLWKMETLLKAYREASAKMLGRRYGFFSPHHGNGVGVAVGIDDRGFLTLKLDDGGHLSLQSTTHPLEEKTGHP